MKNKLNHKTKTGSGCWLRRLVRCRHIDVSQSRLFLPDGSSLLLGNPKLIWDVKGETICQLRAADSGEQIFYANLVVRVIPQRVSRQIQKCLCWLKAKCGNALHLIRWPRLSSQHNKNMVSGFHNFMCDKSKRVALTPNEKS